MDTERLIARHEWTRYLYPLSIKDGKKVKSMTFNLVSKTESGTIHVTDLQLQVGKFITGQVPHSSEMLKLMPYGIDENSNIEGVKGTNGLPATKHGVQPAPKSKYTNMKNRIYNIVGRGHEVIALPNVYHEDYKEELLTSGLDLKLYAKEDFDLLRVSTNDGALVPGRKYDEYGPLANHSLNYKYTREFYFEGGKAGDEIILSATENKASVGGKTMPIGQRVVYINGSPMKFGRQRLMVAPFGSFRLRIEFYKQVTENFTDEYGQVTQQTYLKDVGIGYYGTAEFVHIKGNHKF